MTSAAPPQVSILARVRPQQQPLALPLAALPRGVPAARRVPRFLPPVPRAVPPARLHRHAGPATPRAAARPAPRALTAHITTAQPH